MISVHNPSPAHRSSSPDQTRVDLQQLVASSHDRERTIHRQAVRSKPCTFSKTFPSGRLSPRSTRRLCETADLADAVASVKIAVPRVKDRKPTDHLLRGPDLENSSFTQHLRSSNSKRQSSRIQLDRVRFSPDLSQPMTPHPLKHEVYQGTTLVEEDADDSMVVDSPVAASFLAYPTPTDLNTPGLSENPSLSKNPVFQSFDNSVSRNRQHHPIPQHPPPPLPIPHHMINHTRVTNVNPFTPEGKEKLLSSHGSLNRSTPLLPSAAIGIVGEIVSSSSTPSSARPRARPGAGNLFVLTPEVPPPSPCLSSTRHSRHNTASNGTPLLTPPAAPRFCPSPPPTESPSPADPDMEIKSPDPKTQDVSMEMKTEPNNIQWTPSSRSILGLTGTSTVHWPTRIIMPTESSLSSSTAAPSNRFNPTDFRYACEPASPELFRSRLVSPSMPKSSGGLQLPSRTPSPSWSYYRETFDEMESIGAGSFGVVYKARHRMDGCLYAVKVTKNRADGVLKKQEIMREAYALAAVGGGHPNLLRYFNSWEEDGKLYIVTELCEGGNLALRPDRSCLIKNEEELWEFLYQIGSALAYLHHRGFAHLDVKPENIYVNAEGVYKLGDLSLMSPYTEPLHEEGDSRYLADELLNYDGKDLRPADVFALGASLWELASRTPLPNQGPDWRALREGQWSDIFGLSGEMNHLIRRMMEPNPHQRVTMEQVLSHPLLKRHPETLRLDLFKERVKVAKLMELLKMHGISANV